MKISRLKANRITNPLGFCLDSLKLSWVVEDTVSARPEFARVELSLDPSFEELLRDSGRKPDLDSLAYDPGITLPPRTRVYWR
ncbi:MAG: hypothetical protein LBT59_24335, partial [Clostridiales bacterium]|nr:hypothetical protein [Clostridiales bacterium]